MGAIQRIQFVFLHSQNFLFSNGDINERSNPHPKSASVLWLIPPKEEADCNPSETVARIIMDSSINTLLVEAVVLTKIFRVYPKRFHKISIYGNMYNRPCRTTLDAAYVNNKRQLNTAL